MSAVASTGGLARLSVVVPACDEELLLDATVRSIRSALDESGVEAEIVIVDDGSRDRTAAIADALAAGLARVRALHQARQGIGGAFRSGSAVAVGEYVMLWPADMRATAGDLEPYLRRLGAADVIVGCRRKRVGYSRLMLFNAWLYRRMVGALFGLRLKDVNWIQAYRREKLSQIRLTQHGIPMLAEALVRLRDAGATFVEVDVAMRQREGGVASASRFPVMCSTLLGLLSFWRDRRRERRGAANQGSGRG